MPDRELAEAAATGRVEQEGWPTRVPIVVERNDGHVHAIVEDDGRGFDPLVLSQPGSTADTRLPNLGLLGIQERMTLLGGTMEVESRPGAGTTLFARLPVRGQVPTGTDGPAEWSGG